MDYLNLAYYAAICGALSIFAPSLGNFWIRLGLGMVVGIFAASVLPIVKAVIGS